jgi:hypothetical protein
MTLWESGEPWETPDAAGIFDVPPALQAAIASAATSGATSFKDRFTKAPLLYIRPGKVRYLANQEGQAFRSIDLLENGSPWEERAAQSGIFRA